MDLLTSIRRTVVPMIMGWIITLPIAPYINEAAVETALVAIIGAVYYAVMRLLEERGIRIASFLIGLGVTVAPTYADTGTLSEVAEDERLDTDGGDGSVANS